MTKQEYMDKLNAAWFFGANYAGSSRPATEIKDKYIASLRSRECQPQSRPNRSLVEQMNKMAMRMEHKSGNGKGENHEQEIETQNSEISLLIAILAETPLVIAYVFG